MIFFQDFIQICQFSNGHLSIQNLVELIEKTIRLLALYPKLYPILKIYPKRKMEYRKIVLRKKYVILYALEQNCDTIYLIHIYDVRKNDRNFL